MMTTQVEAVGVRELRQNLSVYLARVKEGQTLTVTEHGLAVAELRPLGPVEDPVARLVAAGVVRPASRAPGALPPPVTLEGATRLSDLLDELREDTV